MLDDLAFAADADRVESAEAAMKYLGLHLGFDAAVSWDAEVNTDSTDCVPVLVAESAKLDRLASAPTGTRVITEVDLASLKDHVRAFAAEVAADRAWERPDAVMPRPRFASDACEVTQ